MAFRARFTYDSHKCVATSTPNPTPARAKGAISNRWNLRYFVRSTGLWDTGPNNSVKQLKPLYLSDLKRSNAARKRLKWGITPALIITMIRSDIHRALESPRRFLPDRKPAELSPSPTQTCYGLTSAIPPGTSFSKVKVGRPFPRRGA
jgi:hypothetical protein